MRNNERPDKCHEYFFFLTLILRSINKQIFIKKINLKRKFLSISRWRGSVYKLVWRELLAYLALYYVINLTYRYALNDEQKQ